ncbi:hypothetical protein [Flammeovirga kamogawensis]|uniref:DUF3375 domain-containing protein n=1 Tax=Flammeovirga kamogawensis TaxID=373891 RepID=A0ABX8GQM2_9BACT|nr:hypothetical protein [Flammeovirga kamogawensis]MBB6462086.1 hypothetical protein [Flammeovirga kamogawensis]QWG05821.1 hypothetical protein KM029_10565 [Flammeovirga kamogawensis]TRX67647.1 hypothetical protein EO216_05585 [Flammeovirga kamogawensis]
MADIQTAEELIKELYRHRKVIQHLFKRKSASFDELIDVSDGKEKEILQANARGIISVQEGEPARLDERLLNFVEDFLEINEDIRNFEVDESIRILKKTIYLYEIDEDARERERYLHRVKRYLNSIGRVIRKNASTLSALVKQEYKTASSIELKRIKIEDHNEQAEKLLELIQNAEELLDNPFFRVVQDEGLRAIVNDLRANHLTMARHNLIALRQEIVRFINQIAELDRQHKKIIQLKKFRDLYELEIRTNVEEVFTHEDALFFDTQLRFQTHLDLDYLRGDGGLDIIERVAIRRQHKMRMQLQAELDIDDALLDPQQQTMLHIDFSKLKRAFFLQPNDLFSFVKSYDFGQEMSEEQLIKVYCQVALIFEDEMDFGLAKNPFDEAKHLEFKGKKLAYITPKRKEKK